MAKKSKQTPRLRLADERDLKPEPSGGTVHVSRDALWTFVYRYADDTYDREHCRGETSDPHRYPDCPAADICLRKIESPIFDFDPRKCALLIWKALTGETVEY